MQTYDRNVCLAAFLLVLGGILVMVGVALYRNGDPDDSGEGLIRRLADLLSCPTCQVTCKGLLSGGILNPHGSSVVCRDYPNDSGLFRGPPWLLGFVSCVQGLEALRLL